MSLALKDANATRLYTYAINDFLLPPDSPTSGTKDFSRLTSIPFPAETFFMAECADKYADSDHFHFADPDDGDYSPGSFRAAIGVERHHQGANYLFAEGHVERLGWRSVSPTLTKSGSRFVDPVGRQP